MADPKPSAKRLFSMGGVCARHIGLATDVQCFFGPYLASSEDEARGLAVKDMKGRYPKHSIEWMQVVEVPRWMIEEASHG